MSSKGAAVTLVLPWPNRRWKGLVQVVDFIGAGEGIRTLDPNLGKVALRPRLHQRRTRRDLDLSSDVSRPRRHRSYIASDGRFRRVGQAMSGCGGGTSMLIKRPTGEIVDPAADVELPPMSAVGRLSSWSLIPQKLPKNGYRNRRTGVSR